MATQVAVSYTPESGNGWTENVGSADDAKVGATLRAFASACGQDGASMTARQLARFWMQESWRRTLRLAKAQRAAEEAATAQAVIDAELIELG